MRIILLISCCLTCYAVNAQRVGGKQVKKIYASLLRYYLSEEPGDVLVADNTSNSAIGNDSFANILSAKFVLPVNTTLDSSWIKDLIEADRQKTILKTGSFPVMKMDNVKVHLINVKKLEAMISAQIKKGIIQKIPDYLQFSSIILTGNRAIVSVEKMTPDLRGNRRLFFLERRKRKWVVVSYLPRSIS